MAERDEQEPAADTDESIGKGLERLSRAAERIEKRLPRIEVRTGRQLAGTAVLGVLCVLVLWLGLSNRDLAERVRSCTDPVGQCYQESRSRTGEVERRILADQAQRSATQLEVVCDLFDSHGLERPPECGPEKPDAAPR